MSWESDTMPSEVVAPQRPRQVDLIVVGAGPAGLALANWFRKSDISVLLLESKPGPTQRGAAEGLKSTTVEIFESFGIGPQIWAEAWRLEEICIWGSADDEKEGIKREQILPDCVPELGKPRECMLQQARCEWHMLQNLSQDSNVQIQYSSSPVELSFDEACISEDGAFPVKVRVEQSLDSKSDEANGSTNGHHSQTEQIEAKYIVGCDGARSWVRKQLGVNLEGDLTDSVFGVMDIVPKTDFPDVRKVCYLKARSGTILLVPRSNKEVRLYIPVESGSTLSDPKNLTFDRIFAAAQTIIAPYKLEVAKCSWWSAYRVGQRVGNNFARFNRAFLAGDAVHTHSPKAGQGMNTSMQDAYNLGWKLRLVLSSVAPSSILSTFESERRPVAQDLIAFDQGYLKLFSAPSGQFDTKFQHASKFTTGLSIRYSSSEIVQLPKGQTNETRPPSLLKADIVPGKRLPDFQVVCQADATTTRIHQRLSATGAFRLILFAGDIAIRERFDRLKEIGDWLSNPANPLSALVLGRHPVAETLLVHSAARLDIELMDLHEIFRPWSNEDGFDYWRVYVDGDSAHEGHGRVYEKLEIDERSTYAVVVRPDGYVGAVAGVDDVEEEVGRYLQILMLRQK